MIVVPFLTTLVIGVFIYGSMRFILMSRRLSKLEKKFDALASGEVDRLLSL